MLIWEVAVFVSHGDLLNVQCEIVRMNSMMFYWRLYVLNTKVLIGKKVMTVNDYQNRLTRLLLEKNENISYGQARKLVKLLWDDFEETYERSGTEDRGVEVTERIVRQWIEQYGDVLHEFIYNNPKYEHLFYIDKRFLH